MQTSKNWIAHFNNNAELLRVNWNLSPTITPQEVELILPSLQAWQLAETSEGRDLIAASTKYAAKIGDPDLVDAYKLFIKEEQKHGRQLGEYLDKIGKPRVSKSWDDAIFRKVRHLNTSMETWTLTVVVVESTAQIFYQSLKDATNCQLLKQICTDLLIDEAYHITFQTERLAVIFDGKTTAEKTLRKYAYKLFFYLTATMVWLAHKNIFKAGGNTFKIFTKKMRQKYYKTIDKITAPLIIQPHELYPKP
jgi:hypothetical protein